MPKKSLKHSWRKLDNTAKIFSLDDKRNINIFRFSTVLKDSIDGSCLKNAINKTLLCFSSFKVRLGTGIFWNYLEFNPKNIIVKEEKENGNNDFNFNFSKNNDYLFRVTYFENKINLDIFHVLTDGTGAIRFLKSIISNYLSLKHDIPFEDETEENNINDPDQYLKVYEKEYKIKSKFKMAYRIPGKINDKKNNTYHYIVNPGEFKKICKSYRVTITEFITALYIYALHLYLCNRKSRKEIIVGIPINLRKYYQVDTMFNFFVCMNVNSKISEKKLTTFDAVLNQVHSEFEQKLTVDKIKSYLVRDVDLGMNIPIRLIPLFIKKTGIRFLGTLFSKGSTSTLSNVGIIDIDNKFKKYIENVFVEVMPNIRQKIKCTICSFEENLNIIINSNLLDKGFENIFLNLLKNQGCNVKLAKEF